MSNPALSNNPALSGKTLTAEELHRIYDQPSADLHRPGVDEPAGSSAQSAAAQAGAVQAAAAQGLGAQVPPAVGSDRPMTYENTINKTVLLFLIVLAFGAVGWMATPIFPALPFIGMVVGLVLGLVNSFKKQPSVPLIIGYAVAEGVFLGGISMFFELKWPGIVSQAIIGTFAVFGVTLLLFRSGKVRTSPRMTKIVLIAMVGYLVFSLVNFGMMMFGATDSMFGMRDYELWGIPLGVIVGLLAVFLAAYSLVMDFELVQNGVRNRVPEKWGWSAAFGLMVTLIWLYVEILRIIAIFRSN